MDFSLDGGSGAGARAIAEAMGRDAAHGAGGIGLRSDADFGRSAVSEAPSGGGPRVPGYAGGLEEGLPRQWVNLLEERGISVGEISELNTSLGAGAVDLDLHGGQGGGGVSGAPGGRQPTSLPGLGPGGSFLSASLTEDRDFAGTSELAAQVEEDARRLRVDGDDAVPGVGMGPLDLLGEAMSRTPSAAPLPHDDASMRFSGATGTTHDIFRGFGDRTTDFGATTRLQQEAGSRVLYTSNAHGERSFGLKGSATLANVIDQITERAATASTSEAFDARGVGTTQGSMHTVASLHQALQDREQEVANLRAKLGAVTTERDQLKEQLRHGAAAPAVVPVDVSFNEADRVQRETLQNKIDTLTEELAQRDEVIDGFKATRLAWEAERQSYEVRLTNLSESGRMHSFDISSSEPLLGPVGDATSTPHVVAQDTAAGRALSTLLEGMTHEKTELFEALRHTTSQLEDLTAHNLELEHAVSQLQAQARRFKMERLLLIAAQRSVGRGFHAMKQAALQERTDRKWRSVLTWLRRLSLRLFPHLMDAGPLWVTYHRWRQNVRDLRQNRTILAKVMRHMRFGSRLRTFNSWKEFVAERKRLRKVAVKVLNALDNKNLLAGMTKWKAYVVTRNERQWTEQHQHLRAEVARLKGTLAEVEAARAHAERLQHRFGAKMRANAIAAANAKNLILLGHVMADWRQDVRNTKRLRHAAKLLMESSSTRVLQRILRSWARFAAQEARLRKVGLRMMNMWKNAAVARILRSWRAFVVDAKRERQIVQRFGKLMRNRSAARVFRSWGMLVDLAKEAQASADAKFAEKQRSITRQIMQRWARETKLRRMSSVQTTHLDAKAAVFHAKLQQSTRRRVLHKWRDVIVQDKREAEVIKNFAFKLKYGAVLRAFSSWAGFTKERIRLRKLVEKTLGRLKGGKLKIGFTIWQRFVVLCQEHQHQLEVSKQVAEAERLTRIVARLEAQNRRVADRMFRRHVLVTARAAIIAWRGLVEQEARLKKAAQWFIQLTSGRAVRRTFDALKTHSEQCKRERAIITKVAARIKYRSVFTTFQSWAAYYRELRTAREQCAKRWMEHKHLRLRQCIQEWRRIAARSIAQRSEQDKQLLEDKAREKAEQAAAEALQAEMDTKMRRIVNMLQGNLAASSFGTWKHNVAERKRLRAEEAFRRTRSHTLVKRAMTRVVRRDLSSGFRQWARACVILRADQVLASQMVARRRIADNMFLAKQHSSQRVMLRAWRSAVEEERTHSVLVERFKSMQRRRLLSSSFQELLAALRAGKRADRFAAMLPVRRGRRIFAAWHGFTRKSRTVECMHRRCVLRQKRHILLNWRLAAALTKAEETDRVAASRLSEMKRSTDELVERLAAESAEKIAETERRAAEDAAEAERRARASVAEVERRAAKESADAERRASENVAEAERRAAKEIAEAERRASEVERRTSEQLAQVRFEAQDALNSTTSSAQNTVRETERQARIATTLAKREAVLLRIENDSKEILRNHFVLWREHSSESVRHDALIRRVSQRLQNMAAARAVYKWKEVAHNRIFLRGLLTRVLSATRLRLLRVGLSQWMEALAIGGAALRARAKTLEIALVQNRRIAARMLFRAKSPAARAFRRWASAAVFSSSGSRKVAQGTVHRAQVRLAVTAWRRSRARGQLESMRSAWLAWRGGLHTVAMAHSLEEAVTASQIAGTEAHKLLQTATSVSILFEQCSDIVQNAFGSHAVGVLHVADGSRGDLWTQDARTRVKRRVPLSRGIVGNAAALSENDVSNDALTDSRFDPDIDVAIVLSQEFTGNKSFGVNLSPVRDDPVATPRRPLRDRNSPVRSPFSTARSFVRASPPPEEVRPVRCVTSICRDASTGGVVGVLQVARVGGKEFGASEEAQLGAVSSFVASSLQRLSLEASSKSVRDLNSSTLSRSAARLNDATREVSQLRNDNERLGSELQETKRQLSEIRERATQSGDTSKRTAARAAAAEAAADELQRQIHEMEVKLSSGRKLLRLEQSKVVELEREVEKSKTSDSHDRRVKRANHERLLMSVDLGNARNELSRLRGDLEFLASAVSEMVDNDGILSDTRMIEVRRICTRVESEHVVEKKRERSRSRSRSHSHSHGHTSPGTASRRPRRHHSASRR